MAWHGMAWHGMVGGWPLDIGGRVRVTVGFSVRPDLACPVNAQKYFYPVTICMHCKEISCEQHIWKTNKQDHGR